MTAGPPAPATRRSLVIGTAGHIDHGKSALVRALTGIDPDRLKEEKARGITIDLGFAHAELPGATIAFIDVPGHERFVRNMLAGAGGIDAVLLVVAADESVKPQTREHFEICRLLGIGRGVVALTKSDLVDADTIALVGLEVRDLLKGSALAEIPILPVSARTDAGLDELRRALEALPAEPRHARAGIVRLGIDRVFIMKGFGTVVTGTLVSGRVSLGDELSVLPGGPAVRVRGVQVHGRSTETVEAAHRVALNLGGVDAADLERGMTLVSGGDFGTTTRVDLEIGVIAGARPIRHGARVRVHHGTSEIGGRVSIAAVWDAESDDWRQPPAGQTGVAVSANGRALVRIRLDAPAVLTRDDRVVLRAFSPPATVAGGVTLDPSPPKAGVRRTRTLERYRALRTIDGAVACWLAEAGMLGLAPIDLVRRGGLSREAAETALGAEQSSGRAVAIGPRTYDASRVGALRAATLGALEQHHREHPLDEGIARGTLRGLVAPRAGVAFFDAVIDDLTSAGQLRGVDRLALAAHHSRPSSEDDALGAQIVRHAHEAGLVALDAAALGRATGAPSDRLERVLRALTKEGALVRLETMYYDAAALAAVADALRQEKGRAGELRLDVGFVKERYGLTRKHAIPLLEWLDRTRVTRRIGNERVVL